jgi:hypothetical protein
MNKLILGFGLLGVVLVGWILFGSNTAEYVASVTDDVAELESNLVAIEADIQAGTFTPQAAAQAQIKIVAKIDSINQAASAGQSATLTDAQRVQLINGLERLRVILTKFQATLIAVDQSVQSLPEADRPKFSGRSNGSTTAVSAASEVAEIAEVQVADFTSDIVNEQVAGEVEANTDAVNAAIEVMNTPTEEPVVMPDANEEIMTDQELPTEGEAGAELNVEANGGEQIIESEYSSSSAQTNSAE